MIQLNVDKNFSDTSYEKAVTLIFQGNPSREPKF